VRFKFALALQRAARSTRSRSKLLGVPLAAIYRLYSLFVLSIDIPVSVQVGRGVRIHHGFGLVIHPNATIGDHVVLRHSTTIGSTESGPDAPAPKIGAGVDIGAGAIVIGAIVIGEGSRIGAGAIVTRSVPPRSVVRGVAASSSSDLS